MTATLPEPGSSFEHPPAGAYPARCIGVIDVGTRDETYNDEKSRKRKVVLEFELGEDNSHGEPFTVTRWFNWSMHEKSNLRKALESWRSVPFKDSDFGPQGFSIDKLIGVAAMLTVGTTDKGKAKIDAISPVPKGMTVPDVRSDTKFVWLDSEDWDAVEYGKLQPGMQKIVAESPEYAALTNEPGPSIAVESDPSAAEDVPF